jgi:hypothetical protein
MAAWQYNILCAVTLRLNFPVSVYVNIMKASDLTAACSSSHRTHPPTYKGCSQLHTAVTLAEKKTQKGGLWC